MKLRGSVPYLLALAAAIVKSKRRAGLKDDACTAALGGTKSPAVCVAIIMSREAVIRASSRAMAGCRCPIKGRKSTTFV